VTARRCCKVFAGFALCGAMSLAAADDVAFLDATAAGPDAVDDVARRDAADVRPKAEAGGISQLWALLSNQLRMSRVSAPDWIRHITKSSPGRQDRVSDEPQLVLQRHRNDGAELLTVRYPLVEFGSVSAYAGAGLNRTVYFAESNYGETFMTRGGRHRAVGAAAELGAELHVSERLAVNAELRWIDLAADAGMLRSGDSLVSADPLALGISLGWRF
jgi:hypothetical protein